MEPQASEPLKEKLPPIRTMQSDAAAASQKPGTSAISLLARRLKQKRDEIPQKLSSPKRTWLIAGILIFLALAVLAGAWIYFKYSKPGPPQKPAAERPEKLIAAEEEILDIKELENILSHGPEVEKFKVIFFNLSPEEFLAETGLKPPARLKSQIQAYNLGLFNDAGLIHPFLIFKVASFEDAFAGTLLWEKNMPEEFQIFFPRLSEIGELEISFQDQVIKNQDARVLVRDGAAEFLYTFFNKNLLLATDSQKTLEAIISRYTIFRPN